MVHSDPNPRTCSRQRYEAGRSLPAFPSMLVLNVQQVAGVSSRAWSDAEFAHLNLLSLIETNSANLQVLRA